MKTTIDYLVNEQINRRAFKIESLAQAAMIQYNCPINRLELIIYKTDFPFGSERFEFHYISDEALIEQSYSSSKL